MKKDHKSREVSCLWLLILIITPFCCRAAASNLPEVANDLVSSNERFWRECQKPADSVTSRDLFAYALVLCEARQHPERLDKLFSLAEQMQDRDPKGHGFGNFWWSWRDGKVTDYNSVDFSMRGGTLLWLKHRDFIPVSAQARLEKLLEFSVQGCLHHEVKPSYSNIAIMNAGDLILLGEELGQPSAADEGYARLDALFRYTQKAGIHEFNSPTYTGVDLDGLERIVTFCRRDSGRVEAEALLKLFWTDVALNWFPSAQKLAGAQSRTYDYLSGLGELDREMTMNGWLPDMPPALDSIFTFQTNWHPPEEIHDLSGQFPRLVRESWGDDWWQSRTHYLLSDITLSSTASSYGGQMDMPLTVDLPGDRKTVRGYFIADGRDDPYGLKEIAAGPHRKAFHLNPFWTAAQRTSDAVGLAIYRTKDIPAYATTLVSNFVMPMDVDSLWIGEQKVILEKGKAFQELVQPGEAITVRKGDAAFGVRALWSRSLDGSAGQIFLVYDGNPYGAVRLAVRHVADGEKPKFAGNNADTIFWVRIGDGLNTDAEFAEWRHHFETAADEVQATPDSIKVSVAGGDGTVSLTANAPWSAPEVLEPAPTRAVLELNGHNIGDKILQSGKGRDLN
ncbi:MAG TPA: hypothetical protein VNU95_01610 [Candidatus Acidoferrales bacterium]|nr:hypothetical protein [Candidatus Acidoferrales bacterium]